MKKLILTIIHSFSIIIITAGLIFAADLTLNSGQILTAQKWSDLVAEITGNTTKIAQQDDTITANSNKNTTQDTTIADLKSRIEALESSSGGSVASGGVAQIIKWRNLRESSANGQNETCITTYGLGSGAGGCPLEGTKPRRQTNRPYCNTGYSQATISDEGQDSTAPRDRTVIYACLKD